MFAQKRGKGRGGKKIKTCTVVMRMLSVQCLPTNYTTTLIKNGYKKKQNL